jgi:hypothetical protein
LAHGSGGNKGQDEGPTFDEGLFTRHNLVEGIAHGQRKQEKSKLSLTITYSLENKPSPFHNDISTLVRAESSVSNHLLNGLPSDGN